MKRDDILAVVTGILIFVVGVLSGCILTSWGWISQLFFQVKLIEVIQLFVTILIAIIVGYFITGGIARGLKKRDVISDLISKIQNNLSVTLSLSYEYIKTPDSEKERRVLINFKNLSMLIGIATDVSKIDNALLDHHKALHNDFLRFKEAVTDTPFGQKEPNYSSKRTDSVQEGFNAISKRLYEYKISLYS
jgi:hypothetical protein